MDQKDYNITFSRFRRPSVRGVIIKDGKIALVYSKKYDYYKFPGGGIENNEDHITTLKREVLEETGLTIIDETVKELGSVLRIQKSRFEKNVIFEQENFYYLCNVENSVNKQLLDKYELDEGFILKYVLPELAISVNRTHDHGDYDLLMIEREARVLEYIVEKGYL
jgi:8-oxo-dGTP pyrophosphatase MutT (NUDIX family)